MKGIHSGARARDSTLIWIISLGLLIVAGTIGLTVALLWDARIDARRAADRDAQNIASTLEKDIIRNIELFDLSVQGVIIALQNPTLMTLTGQARQLALFDQAATATYFNALLVLDENGRVVEDSRSRPLQDVNLSDRDYFLAQKSNANAGLYISRPFTRRNADAEWVLALSRRLNKADGTFGGVVVGTIKTAYFQHLVEGLSVGPNGTVSISRSDGALIARSPLPPAGLSSDFRNANVYKHFPTQQSGRFEAAATSDGVWRRFTFRDVSALPILIAVGFASQDIYGAWEQKAFGLAIVTLALLVAMIALAVLLWKEMAYRKQSEKKLRESETRYRLLADSSSDAIVLRDASGQRKYASPSYYALVGRSAEELGTKSIVELLGPEAQSATKDTYRHLREGRQGVVTCFECPRPDGTIVWLETISSAIFDANGTLTEVVSNIRDVTNRHNHEADLARAATTDGLTGLMNRRSFDQMFAREWKRALRDGREISLIMIDVDHFKLINDTFGHLEGDRALERLSTIIAENVCRPGDFVCRYGGEEFVVVLPATDEVGSSFVAKQIQNAVRAAALPNPKTRRGTVTISLGVATSRPERDSDGAQLIRAADAALYGAKLAGRDRCRMADTHGERLLRKRA